MSSHAESLRHAYASVVGCRAHFGVLDGRVRCGLIEHHDGLEHCAAIGLYWEDDDARCLYPEDAVILPAEQANADHVEAAFAEERANA